MQTGNRAWNKPDEGCRSLNFSHSQVWWHDFANLLIFRVQRD